MNIMHQRHKIENCRPIHGIPGLENPKGSHDSYHPVFLNVIIISGGYCCYEVHFMDGETESVRDKDLIYGHFMTWKENSCPRDSISPSTSR